MSTEASERLTRWVDYIDRTYGTLATDDAWADAIHKWQTGIEPPEK